ncbi:hypothetical protein KC344_g228 [Hortaea werneckii]|nr:hypothetical protein KC344_g228 [Hortaea werneckii]
MSRHDKCRKCAAAGTRRRVARIRRSSLLLLGLQCLCRLNSAALALPDLLMVRGLERSEIRESLRWRKSCRLRLNRRLSNAAVKRC